MTRRSILALTCIGLLGSACGAPSPSSPDLIRVVIPSGAGFSQVTDTLVARQIITSPRWFRFLARVGGYDRSIKAGTYELAPDASAMDVLETLNDGRSVLLRLTVPEGLPLRIAVDLIAERSGVGRDSLVAAAQDTALLRTWGIPASSGEGFLFPETYFYQAGASARDLVTLLLSGFRAGWDPRWDVRLDTLGLTKFEAVTLASIVEGEARVDDERPVIAAVYHNRLRIGMPLQADPTVQYAIAQRSGERKPRLFEKDYEVVSPYNTYLNPGLPPGPVNSPGRKSLEATMHPATVSYLFFVARTDGRHVFSETFAEHLRAIARIRQEEQAARGR